MALLPWSSDVRARRKCKRLCSMLRHMPFPGYDGRSGTSAVVDLRHLQPGERLSVGRDSAVSVSLGSMEHPVLASRLHAEIWKRSDGALEVTDAQSVNGTCAPAPLQSALPPGANFRGTARGCNLSGLPR